MLTNMGATRPTSLARDGPARMLDHEPRGRAVETAGPIGWRHRHGSPEEPPTDSFAPRGNGMLFLGAVTAVALMMFLIQQSQSVNFMGMITFNIVYYCAESIRATPQLCVGVRPCLRSAVLFQGCQRRIGNSSCTVSLLC